MRRASRALFLGSICALALATSPGESAAIEPPPGAVPIPPPRGAPKVPRLRFGVGGAGALTTTPLLGMIAGPYVKVGVQASDLVGAYAHLSATTTLGSYDFRGALVADLTFADRVSIGTGASAQAYFAFGGDPYVLVGAPIHVAVYAEHYPGLDAARRAVVFSLDGDLGVAFGRFVPGRDADRRFGAAVMLGIGYEVF